MKKKQAHRKFTCIVNGDDNKLLCERAVEIAAEHFNTEYCEEVETGIWIVLDHAGRIWCFQKKPDGFIMDTPYISSDDVNNICALMVKYWEAGMSREIEQIAGPFDPKDGLTDYYQCEITKVRYHG